MLVQSILNVSRSMDHGHVDLHVLRVNASQFGLGFSQVAAMNSELGLSTPGPQAGASMGAQSSTVVNPTAGISRGNRH